MSKVLREAHVGAGRVVARVLGQEALELVSEVCSGGSGMELTELSPVRQWARGGELRATGHHRSVHHWAMPTHRGEAGEEEEEQSVSVAAERRLYSSWLWIRRTPVVEQTACVIVQRTKDVWMKQTAEPACVCQWIIYMLMIWNMKSLCMDSLRHVFINKLAQHPVERIPRICLFWILFTQLIVQFFPTCQSCEHHFFSENRPALIQYIFKWVCVAKD